MSETVMPDLPTNPTLQECQLAYTTILGTSLKALPKRRKKSVHSPHKNGWSPMMAGLKVQTNMLQSIQWQTFRDRRSRQQMPLGLPRQTRGRYYPRHHHLGGGSHRSQV